MQLMDEIPMVWSSSAFIYSLYMVSKHLCLILSVQLLQTPSKPGEKGLLPLFLLSLYSTLFTLIYSIWQDPLVHQVNLYFIFSLTTTTVQVMYGVLVVVMILQASSMLYHDRETTSLKLFVAGLILYGVGFLLWNIGNLQYLSIYSQ